VGALTQQMTLDLQVFWGPVQHFDSGVVPVNVAFPTIHVSCAAHGFVCHDSVLVVDAVPVENAGVPPSRLVSGIELIQPNPFARSTRIVLRRVEGPVEVTVFDMNGRRIRRLMNPALAASASSVVTWDGCRDDGRETEAGVYWVSARWPGGSDGQRIVKLE